MNKKRNILTLNLDIPKFPRKKMAPAGQIFVDKKKQKNKRFCRGNFDG